MHLSTNLRRDTFGFSHIFIIFLIVVVGSIGFIGWRVMHPASKPAAANVAATQPEKKRAALPKIPAARLPSGYIEYKNTADGYTFAYPGSWGELDPAGLYSPYVDNQAVGVSWIQGRLAVQATPATDFTIGASKYGATIKPLLQGENISWEVVSVNPAETNYSAGDPYTVTSRTNPHGIKIYDLTWSDEGATHARRVFKSGGKLVVISLPAILRQYMEQVPVEDMAEYNETARNIADSIKLL